MGEGPLAENALSNAQTEVARDRVVRLFKFVSALYEQRNPATRQMSDHEWILRFSDIPDHESISLAISILDSDDDSTAESLEPRPLLVSTRPKLTKRPSALDCLDSWLDRDWDDCRAKPLPVASKNELIEGGETRVTRFEDSLERVATLETYQAEWTLWAQNERIAQSAGEIFEKLYKLHGILQRDGERYELVVADGILSWSRPGGGVRHPLITRAVRLDFDPQTPAFRIVESGDPSQFYSALFRSMTDVDGSAVGRLRSESDALDLHPLGGADVVGFLKSVSSTLSAKGIYVGPEAPGPERDFPVIGRGPTLLLRRRTVGVARAFDAIIEDLSQGKAIPVSLKNVVGITDIPNDVSPLVSHENQRPGMTSEEMSDDSILFTKEANPEQLDIARSLNRDNCVLVQGPPGTGKTHTIANLLGHLLAQGKSVLVLSHTTKALKVLREKVVPQLQPLCVSVLDSKDDDAALKSSIEGIVERVGNVDIAKLDREIVRYGSERSGLIGELAQLRESLVNARLDEQREIIIGGEGIRPISAAVEVSRGLGSQDWIPDGIAIGSPQPLSQSEVAELYGTNRSVTREDETALALRLPDKGEITQADDFAALCQERRELSERDRFYRPGLWTTPKGAIADQLDAALQVAIDAVSACESLPSWVAGLVVSGISEERFIWEELLAEVSALRSEALVGQRLVLVHTPVLAHELDVERASEIYSAIESEIKKTGKLPSFLALLSRPEWKKAIQGARVGAGSSPRLPEHFSALARLAQIESRRQAFRRRWDAQVKRIGGPSADSLGRECEVGAKLFSPMISNALDWVPTTWAKAESLLSECGLAWHALIAEANLAYPDLDNAGRISKTVSEILPKVLGSERARRRWKYVDDQLQIIKQKTISWPANQAIRPLRDAIDAYDEKSYRRESFELERLRMVLDVSNTRFSLLTRLERFAPGWASAIRGRIGIHGLFDCPSDVDKAWRWRQFESELNRRNEVSIPDILQNIEQKRGRLREVTTNLVDRRAWRAQAARTTLSQRQALLGFAESKRRIGRGTGKRAAHFARAARERMADARSAVPVWIMPVVKAAEVFDPQNTRFDVVIIDEASQSDVTGLLAFYLGDQIVVVGDDEQVSPSAVGEKADEAQHLIDEMLQGIPDAQLFDGKQSLYDIAKRSFGGTICLLEHFRCVPEIIQFSNELSYAGRIKPLRERHESDPEPSVVEHRVVSSVSEGKVNEREALAVASLVLAAIEQREYDGKTFGIISMVGDEQAYRIEQILRAVLTPAVVEARRLLAGSAAQFQGDERNVMFLSLVDTGQGVPLPLRDTRSFQQRYNVAASRAQDQMWIVHSLDRATELKPGDLRRRLIEHATDPGAAERNKAAALKKAESKFEEAVIQRLTGAGFWVETQRWVGAYRLDIVVHGENRKRLAIECDGDRYHTIETLREDTERQAILERVGWTFSRIRGSKFFRDEDTALRPVFEKLASMGIEPHAVRTAVESGNSELVSRVKVRAAELETEIGLIDFSTKSPVRKSWRKSLAQGRGGGLETVPGDGT